MARSKISDSGTKVIISLSFSEAAALEALLRRIGEATHEEISFETLSLWENLRDIRDMVQDQDEDLWPSDFERFADSGMQLQDPADPIL